MKNNLSPKKYNTAENVEADAEKLVEYITYNVKTNKLINFKLEEIKTFLNNIQSTLNTIKRLLFLILIIHLYYVYVTIINKEELFIYIDRVVDIFRNYFLKKNNLVSEKQQLLINNS